MLSQIGVAHLTCPALFQNIGWAEVLLILLVVLLLFGGRKLPELARGLGRGLRTFKEELEGAKKDVEEPAKKDQEPAKKDQDSDKDDKSKDSQST